MSLRIYKVSDYSSVSKLENLTSLNLSSNGLSDISFLSELSNLTSLNLSSNRLSDISFLLELINLTSLNLRKNKISDISSLSQLKSLSFLDLRDNKILDISSLQNLKELSSLYLSSNQISDISFLSKLKGLTSLELGSNQIPNISFLSQLKRLTSLYLSSNQISDISLLSELKGLTSLYLNSNQISDISFLFQLKRLTSLELISNQISSIKGLKEIVENRNLKYFYLYNNPIPYLPKELLGEDFFDNCLQDLRNYFQNQDFVPNKEIKVVLLGNGMVGKSTLLNRFLNPTGDWETEIQIDISDRTEGIVIKENIPFDLENEKEIRLNIWDFGGQEVYHGTHRLFLDKDAVYIIVWALETDEQQHEIRQDLNYWFDYVQDLAIDSPVILVHSQCDKESEKNRKEINKQLDISELPQYNKNIIENDLSFSAKTGEGLNQLNEAIKKAIKDKLSARVETEIPKKWSDLRDNLRRLRENENNKINEISKLDYLKECEKYEIKESEAETVLTFLHRTGFLYYDEKLSKNIILNQTWAIEAIYEALKPSGLAADCHGKLSFERLNRFWTQEIAKKYSENEVKTFVDFMVSSEICFCKEQQHYRYLDNPTFIVPHYLPEPANSFTRWRYKNSFYIIYQPTFFHKGIAERFLSRLGRLNHETDVWKDGIRIFSETFKGEALIIFDRENKKVKITTENYELLEAVINELNKILDEGSQTKPSEKVTFFYSLDGEELVEKEDLLEGKELNSDFVFTTEKNKVKLKPILEKYRLIEPQKITSHPHQREFSEQKLQDKSLKNEADNKKNFTIMNENQINLIIQKALKHLENANYDAYFQEMDKIVPAFQRTIYSELKGKFIAGQVPYNFHQSLSTFARELNINLIQHQIHLSQQIQMICPQIKT